MYLNIILFEKLSIYILWTAAIIDPHGSLYGLRYFALIFSIFISCFTFIRNKTVFGSVSNGYRYLFILLVIIMPIYGVFIGTLRGGMSNGQFIDTSYIAAGILYLTSLIYLNNGRFEQLVTCVLSVLKLFCVLIIAVYISVSLDLLQSFTWFWVEKNAALLSVRDYGSIKLPYIYFFASPMLLSLLSYYAWQIFNRPSIKSLLSILLPWASLILSGTRANIILSFACIGVVLLWRSKGKFVQQYVVSVALVILLASSLIFSSHLKTFFDITESSNSTKIGYLANYNNIFSDSFTLFFGQGYNAHVWSIDFMNTISEGASKTELTYLELVRVYGLSISVIFLFVLVFIINSIRYTPFQYQWLGPAVIMNLLVSIANPYLFSTNGILLLGLAAALASNFNQVKHESKGVT